MDSEQIPKLETTQLPQIPNTTPPRSHKNPQTIVVALILLVSLIAGFAGGWLGSTLRSRNSFSGNSTELAKQIVADESQLISSIASEVGPSVVSVNVTSQAARQDLYGNVRSTELQSAGTGFIISENGYIVTNRHVIPRGATQVTVTLSDGTELDNVEVVGRTNDSDPLDVAFLQVKDAKGKTLKPVKLGDSSKVQVGYMVIAIGNALGQFQNTVTSGILSGFGRNVQAQGQDNELENLNNLFQTDAAINQGNSGGPLVNADGEVIGINTAVAGEGAENIGFAIPINDVKGLITSVLNKGKLERAFLGVRYITLNDEVAAQYDLTTKRGAYIISGEAGQAAVIPSSPAANVGLKDKDIIVKVNDHDVNEKNNLTSVLGRYTPGEKVTLTIIRDGKEQKIDVTLGVAPQN